MGMIILGKLNNSFYTVYTVKKIKKLKKSTTVELFVTGIDGSMGLKGIKYNMPDQEITDKIDIKYKGPGTSYEYWRKGTDYTICCETCKIYESIVKAYEERNKLNKIIFLREKELDLKWGKNILLRFKKDLKKAEDEIEKLKLIVEKRKKMIENQNEKINNIKLDINRLTNEEEI